MRLLRFDELQFLSLTWCPSNRSNLKPQFHEETIRRILPALWRSENELLLSEKLHYGLMPKMPFRLLKEGPTLQVGGNPRLLARIVTSLFIEEAEDGIEILHWEEPEWWDEKGDERRPRVPRSIRSDSMFYTVSI
jgi:hypothetical protein